MLLHVTPKIISKYSYDTVSLIDVAIPEIGVILRAGKELKTGKPLPNKTYHVACRKTGRKSYSGFYIETPTLPVEFSVTTRWSLNADRILVHDVRCSLLDNDFDAISLNPLCWSAFHGSGMGPRTPSHLKGLSPLEISPVMEVLHREKSTMRSKVICHDDHADGYLVRRTEQISLPTIERSRLEYPMMASMACLAPLSDAFNFS